MTIQFNGTNSLTMPAINGVATFSGLTLATAGNYTLQATSVGLTSASTMIAVDYTPAQIRHAYGFDTIPFLEKNGQPDAATYNANAGLGQTIALEVLFGDPKIQSDVAAFDTQFGLPNAVLSVVNQTGGSNLPVVDSTGQWESEAALDVEWEHAIAPQAKILLVECDPYYSTQLHPATDNGLFSIATGAKMAAGTPGVSVVCINYDYFSGGKPAELPNESSYDGYFTTPAGHPGVTFLAATHDYGAPTGYPAYSPNVIAVGGTTLNLKADNSFKSETGWAFSGGGTSTLEPEPSYQLGVQSSGNRTAPDVSFDANPVTGVYEYDSYPLVDVKGTTVNGSFPWLTGNGTSLATPCWTALIALVDQERAQSKHPLPSLDGPTQTLPALYGLAVSNPSDFHVISGSNNVSPIQYDLVTGLGSPVANKLVPDLSKDTSLVAVGSVTLPTPLLQNIPTQAVLLAEFTQGAATQAAVAYSATVSWGDGSTNTTADANSPLTIFVSGQIIKVYGTHAFTASGALKLGVAINGPGTATATAYSIANVATDVSNEVGIARSGVTYNRATKLFYGSLSITNNTATNLPGSLDILFQGLTSGVTLAYASVSIGTTTYSLNITLDSSGDPFIHISQNLVSSLLPGKTLSIALRFSNPSLALFSYKSEVYSDMFDN